MQNSKGSVMNALYKIADGHAEAMEFVANATTRNRDTPLRELRLKPGILVAVLVHQGRIVIPDGSSSIAAGDTVIVISATTGFWISTTSLRTPFWSWERRMNFRLVFKLTGKTLLVEAGALLLPLLVCLFYRENPLPFLLSIAMTGAVGSPFPSYAATTTFSPGRAFSPWPSSGC